MDNITYIMNGAVGFLAFVYLVLMIVWMIKGDDGDDPGA